MTSGTLVAGCTLIAFSPTATLFFILVRKKAQLVIIVTISAFAFLLSYLTASSIWIILPQSIQSSPFTLIPIGVFSQFLLRLLYVRLYFKIEQIIHTSLHRMRMRARRSNSDSNSNSNSNINNSNDETDEETLLHFELNDWICGIASGIGFGGTHSILLYGTLLTSEAGNLGTLYQPSCPAIPSLLLSAINAFLFSILDMILMLFTFDGVRKQNHAESASVSISASTSATYYFRQSNGPGVRILLYSLCFHLGAAFVTAINSTNNGCLYSVPSLFIIVISCFFFFRVYIFPNFGGNRFGDMEHMD